MNLMHSKTYSSFQNTKFLPINSISDVSLMILVLLLILRTFETILGKRIINTIHIEGSLIDKLVFRIMEDSEAEKIRNDIESGIYGLVVRYHWETSEDTDNDGYPRSCQERVPDEYWVPSASDPNGRKYVYPKHTDYNNYSIGKTDLFRSYVRVTLEETP